LEILKRAMNFWVGENAGNVIKGKLQSMIDNYCEPNPNKPNFTQDQKNFICYQIGDWYLMMKPLLEGQHNLGYMKEKLKIMVCDDEMPINC